MSEPAPPQRRFSPSHAIFPAPAARATAAIALVHAATAALGLLLGRSLIGPPRQTAALTAFLLILNGGAMVLYWQLGRWLVIERNYRGADLYLRLAAGITLVDLAVRLGTLYTTGVFSFASFSVLGPYGVMLGYPHLQYFALGTVLIALGYSLLRMPNEAGLLRAYAFTAIAMGMAYAGFLGNLTSVPAIAGDLLLARLFWGAARSPAPRAPTVWAPRPALRQ